jgi:predicted MPP superfamily phosphohydrolase
MLDGLLNVCRGFIAVTVWTLQDLIARVGSEHVERRLDVENKHEAKLFGRGLVFFNLENWYSAPLVIKAALKLIGLYSRARRNADHIVIRRNFFEFAKLPPAFENFTILQLSDLHVDLSEGAMRHLVSIVGDLEYDMCVLTGDYRGKTYGPFDASLRGLKELRARLKGPLYGVLGNHDSIHMAPPLEAMGVRMLFNECEKISRNGDTIYLAGVDDAHFYHADNIKNAAKRIPLNAFSILLSHTPEVYNEAANAGFGLMLSGHTHGGQLCLPGRIAIKLAASLPRKMGAGAWHHLGMAGYTSVGVGTSLLPVRLNCPAEITLHTLRRPR